jgi:hypothetical protein
MNIRILEGSISLISTFSELLDGERSYDLHEGYRTVRCPDSASREEAMAILRKAGLTVEPAEVARKPKGDTDKAAAVVAAPGGGV